MTLQLGPVEGVGSESRTLEPVADVGQVRDPAQVHWDRVERHEETAEQQERNWHHGGQEHTVLKENFF